MVWSEVVVVPWPQLDIFFPIIVRTSIIICYTLCTKGNSSHFRHNVNKKVTYFVALKIMQEMALDRICVVVPSQILQAMNEEVQRQIQLIDRHCREFCQLPWVTTKAQIRRAEIDKQEALIRKWRDDFVRVEKQIITSEVRVTATVFQWEKLMSSL